MGQCIFCRKQTNNEYSYYVADKAGDKREEVSVFACTRCLKKTSIIVLSILSFFFLFPMIIGAIGLVFGAVSGRQWTDSDVITWVFMAALTGWAAYYTYRIMADKPLSETSAAKKLIEKAKKAMPSKLYFTPAENALLPVQADKPVQAAKKDKPAGNKALENEILNAKANGAATFYDAIIDEATKRLIQLYRSSPKGEGFLIDSYAADPVVKIGELLNETGGFELMLDVHKHFAGSYPVMGAARNLESVWNGIGDWQG